MTDPSRMLRPRFITRAAVRRLGVLGILLVGLGVWVCVDMIRMPGKSFRGDLPPLDDAQAALAEALKRDVEVLAGEIGERNVYVHAGLEAAARHIESSLAGAGYEVKRQSFEADGTGHF